MPLQATTQGMPHVYPLFQGTTQGTLQQVDHAHPKTCRPRISKAYKYFVPALSSRVALEQPGKI